LPPPRCCRSGRTRHRTGQPDWLRLRRHDGDFFADECVDERGLADVRFADNGDESAAQIISTAGYALAGLVKSVLARGFSRERNVKIIACGSVLTKVPAIFDIVRAEIGDRGVLLPLQCDAALGAVNIALEAVAQDRLLNTAP